MPSVESFLAEPQLRATLAADPTNTDALRELAVLCVAQHKDAEALELRERLRAAGPESLEDQASRVEILHRLERPTEAMTLAETMVATWPQAYEAHWAAGQSALVLGQYQRARLAFGQCCMLRPTDPRAFVFLADTVAKLGLFSDAARVRADLIAYTLPQVHDHLLMIADHLRSDAKTDDALAVAHTARLIFPNSAATAEHHARALLHACRVGEAWEALRRAEELGAAGPGLEITRAGAWHLSRQPAAAAAAADKAVELAPDDSTIRLNRSLLHMALGRWDQGWQDFEARLEQLRWPDYDRLWDGAEMTGTLLLVGEQGLGDQIQSLRYLPLIRPKVGRLVLSIADPLVRLAQGLPGIDELRPASTGWPDYDRVLPVMSLQRIVDRGRPGSAPAPVPFLRPPPDPRVTVPTGPGLKVGLCWAGNPSFAMDHARSMPASEIARLVRKLPQARYFSLHRGPVSPFVGQLPADLPVPDAVGACTDYADTASVIDALDLVITVDTSIAHLAGALGKETWLLLPYVTCYRWLGGDTSLLYPSMRYFRQPHPGEGWAETMDRVAQALAERLPR